MFTGLIEAIGDVVAVEHLPGAARLFVSSEIGDNVTPGDSLAVNGACLTVVQSGGGTAAFDVGPQTMQVTTLGELEPGSIVNLERPMRGDARFGGHFVQGHVDAIGWVQELRQEAEFHWLTVSFPPELARYIVHKGSIAVDGISLTVAGLGADRFDIMVIPFTMAHTNLGRVQLRDRVNLECDMVGKYVIRAAELAGLTFTSVRPGEVTH